MEEKTTRQRIMDRLGDYHTKHGVIFLSLEEATDYYIGLIEIIEDEIEYEKNGKI